MFFAVKKNISFLVKKNKTKTFISVLSNRCLFVLLFVLLLIASSRFCFRIFKLFFSTNRFQINFKRHKVRGT